MANRAAPGLVFAAFSAFSLVGGRAGHATPSTTPAVVDITIDEAQVDRHMRFHHLPAATSAPGGLEIPADEGDMWKPIGLAPGDIIRFENGTPAADRLSLYEGRVVLEVDRKGKPLIVRVVINGPTERTETLSDSDREHVLDRLHSTSRDPFVSTVHVGNATAVRIDDMLLTLFLGFKIGDIVHSIGGQPIESQAQLVAAVEKLAVGQTKIEVDRLGRAIEITIEREAPLDLVHIKHVSKTELQVPSSVREAVKKDLWLLKAKADFAPGPVAADGKAHGVRLFNLQPDSVLAAVGLEENDVIVDVNGMSVDSVHDALETHSALEDAPALTVQLDRKGKRVQLDITFE